MKAITSLLFVLLATQICSAQFTIRGNIIDKDKRPLEGVTISLFASGKPTINAETDSSGHFTIPKVLKGSYNMLATYVSMNKQSIEIEIKDHTSLPTITLTPTAFFLEPLEIRSVRASEKAPFAKTNLTKVDLASINTGLDLPILLNQTPGAVVNSDAGNGIGYTAIRIRGSDATRINVTLNGIPYNDAESQGTFFVDLPDIVSSAQSIQIQRGVGSSSNGAGAFGATISLSTNEFNEKPYANINNSFGSFQSWKNTLMTGTGLLNNHFTVDMRLSRISSNGFIDRASSNLSSLFLSAAYTNKKTSVRVNLISGKEKTYQAWYGIPENIIDSNRTLNLAGTEKPGTPYENETDNYLQDHYQLFLNHQFSDKIAFNTAAFLTTGEGYYEQYKAAQEFVQYNTMGPVINGIQVATTDLIRQLWLKNYFYGQIFSLQYKNYKNMVTIGGGWNHYIGNHFGKVIWAETGFSKDHEWYRLRANKTDINLYTKWQHNLGKRWSLFADFQYRRVNYLINGFRNNPQLQTNTKFNFFNPKAGITYQHNDWQAYISYAQGNKEPNRDDFEAGNLQQPLAETLHDFEAGFEKKSTRFSVAGSGYYMLYHNQLILTGKINDVGAYTRTNVPLSYRFGVELQSMWSPFSWLTASTNIAVSKNKIKAITEFVDDYDNGGQKQIEHRNTDIAFSPGIVGGATVTFLPVTSCQLSLISKYVGRQFLDNTMNQSRSLEPFYVQDLRILYTIKNKLLKEYNFNFTLYNLLNKKYSPNGYTFSYIAGGQTSTENYLFPMAGINFMFGINIKI